MEAVTLFAAGILLTQILFIAISTFFLIGYFTENEGLHRYLGKISDLLDKYYREMTFIGALTATSGSLYLSEFGGLEACELCWYQRILIFPVVILLGVALILEKEDVADYVMPLTVLGIPISLYHYLIQWTGLSSGCSTQVSCSSTQVIEFGYITIPMMSLTFFVVTAALMLFEYRNYKNDF